jgi:hypothetical protein
MFICAFLSCFDSITRECDDNNELTYRQREPNSDVRASEKDDQMSGDPESMTCRFVLFSSRKRHRILISSRLHIENHETLMPLRLLFDRSSSLIHQSGANALKRFAYALDFVVIDF